MTKLVDPKDWKKMDGENDIIKQINSYLSYKIIGLNKLPSDECLYEANEIYHKTIRDLTSINKYLNYQFGYEGDNSPDFTKESGYVLELLKEKDIQPCLVCGGSVRKLSGLVNNLDSGCRLSISGCYGSDFDCTTLKAVICDKCIEDAFIERKFYSVQNEAAPEDLRLNDEEINNWIDTIKTKRGL